MEVEPVDNKGCLWTAGAVLSLGFLPILARSAARKAPTQLTEDALVLRDGRSIPWSAFTRLRATETYLGSGPTRRYIRTRYVLKYSGGEVAFATDSVRDADVVVAYVRNHIPPEALLA